MFMATDELDVFSKLISRDGDPDRMDFAPIIDAFRRGRTVILQHVLSSVIDGALTREAVEAWAALTGHPDLLNAIRSAPLELWDSLA